MEKFGKNIGKNLRKATMIGLSALSLSPKLDAQNLDQKTGNNSDFDLKNKIEWTRSELKTNEGTKELASSLAEDIFSRKEIYKKNTQEGISCLNYVLEYLSTKAPTPENLKIKKESERKLEEYKKKLKNLENLERSVKVPPALMEEKINDMQKIVSYYDIGRQWILDNLKNPEYTKRLEWEEKESFPNMSAVELEEYIKKISSFREKQATDDEFIISKDIVNSYSHIHGYSQKDKDVEAFYINNKVYLPIDNNEDSLRAVNDVIHEYSHKITKSNEFLSKKSIRLFLEAFNDSSAVSQLHFSSSKDISKLINYFSDPTEMYARKKVFDYDLERLGIKKYGEKFTMGHYFKMLKLGVENKLSKGSYEFLYIIKPEMIERVMNEIADVGFAENQNKNIA